MHCPRCHTENRPQAKFCEECAAPLARACAHCGAELSPTAKFCPECAHPAAAGRGAQARFASPESYTPRHLAEKILTSKSALEGERKQVTVLFADVSGFTSLSERLDPEEVHALINRAFELMLTGIHRYEGTVNQFLGDGLMALFGAPIAHEDHAQRAAHAALDMQHALAGYRAELERTRGVDFRMRMGLNTGLVVVGAVGDNLRMDYTAVGDTTNTAARMQQLAEPGQIVVASATERLIAPYFELEPLGTFTVKNRTQPVAAYAVRQPKSHVTRLAARASQGLSPLVGRDEALAMLNQAFTAARAGRGQVVFVVGDAGIGKSRLVYEFRQRLGDAVTWLQGESVSFGQSSPFLPVIEVLKRIFGIEDRDPESGIAGKIDAGLEVVGDDAAALAPYLRYLLSVDPGDAGVARLDPMQRRGKIVDAVLRLAAARSRRRPLVVLFEDLHWIEVASEDFLKRLIESLPGMAVLLLLTHRPVYQPPFGDRTYFWRLPLQPVAQEDAIRIVRATLGAEDLPPDLATLIARKAEGNPFFLEEIGRTLVEQGAVRLEDGRLFAAASASTITVPDTVQDVLSARIDRLGEGQKRTVQTASVIGRQFALELLQRVSDVQDQLERSLAELTRIEMIYENVEGSEREYLFRHALTQDVAYGSLLQAERRRLHARIGAAIEDAYPGRLEERTEELVFHFTRGEVWDKVVQYAREAAGRAAGLFIDARAVELYELALDALARLPDSPEHARTGIDLRLAMRAPLWRAGRLEPLFERFKEAEALATRLGETSSLDTIYSFLVQYYWAKGEPQRALEYGQRCLEMAEARNDLGLRVTGKFYMCWACEGLGRYREGVEHARDVIGLLEGPREQERFGLSGLPYSGVCAVASWCLAELGDFGGARELLRQGERVAVAADHVYSRTTLAICHGYLLLHQGRPADAVAILGPATKTCREKNFAGWLMLGLSPLAYASALLGQTVEAIPLAQEAITAQEKTGAFVNRAYMHMTLARVYLEAGDLERAEASARTGLGFADQHAERGWRGWNHWVLGEVAARRDPRDPAQAEDQYHQATRVATELGMRPLAAHCHVGLGTLYGRLTRQRKAQEHLTIATTMFRGMDMLFWLEKARATITAMGGHL